MLTCAQSHSHIFTEPLGGNDPPSTVYKTVALPLSYRGIFRQPRLFRNPGKQCIHCSQCKHQTHIHSDCFQSVLTLSIISHEHNHVNMRSFLSACRTDVIMHSWTYGLSRMAGESNPVSCYAHRISSAAVHRSHRHPFNYQTTICY